MTKEELLAYLDKEKEKCLQEKGDKIIEVESRGILLMNIRAIEKWLRDNKEFTLSAQGSEWRALNNA